MTTYTQTELDNAVDKARMEIMEAVKAMICDPKIRRHSYMTDLSIAVKEIEEGFIGKSD